MKGFRIFSIAVLGPCLLAGNAIAQQKTLKEQIVGDWAQASNITTRADGTKVETWGANSKSVLIFQSNGRMATVVIRGDLPKFASNNRTTGTADENKAVVQGSIAYFGTYSVDEGSKTLIIQIEGATFPNWIGATQKRALTISGDELTQSVAAASGGGSVEIKYKRLK